MRDRNIILETDRLIVRNWIEADHDLMHDIHSDPKVLEFFPHGYTRVQSDRILNHMRKTIDKTGFGFYALERKQDGRPIGFCGLKDAEAEPILPAGTIEIGWRLALEFWGQGYVTEAATAVLEYGFKAKSLPEIVAFAVRKNARSIAVMERIGLKRDRTGDFDDPDLVKSHPHLAPNVVYKMTRKQWRVRNDQRG